MSTSLDVTRAHAREQRLARVESVLAEGNSPKKAVGIVKREFGISRRQAYRYVRLALERWVAEADGTERSSVRAQMRENMWDLYQTALAKQRTVVPGKGEPFDRDDPDIRGAAMVLDMLARLDGAYEQPGGGSTTVVLGDSAIEAVTGAMLGREVIDATSSDD